MTTSKKSQPHHQFIHGLSLAKSLILSWLAVLLAGAFLHQGIRFFHDHASFVPSFSTSYTSSSDPTWSHLESHGDVELLRRVIDLEEDEYSKFATLSSAKGLYAHRAVATVDIPIETLLHVFRDTPNNVSWLL